MSWSKVYGDNKDAITIGPWEDNKWNVEEEDEEEEEEEQWDDGIFTAVRKLIVFHGSKVTAIQIEYDKDGRSVWSETHGEVGGGKVDIIVLDYPNEFLTAIGGCFGSFPGVLKSLTLYSNRCKYGPYGEDLEEVFICRAANAKIVGFHGKTGPNLKSIGVHLKLDNNYRDTCVGISDERGDSNYKKRWSKGYEDSKDVLTIGPWRREGNKWNVEEEWDDGIFTTVRQFVVSHGANVNSIQIEYDKDGRSVWSEMHGEAGGGKVDIIRLDYPNEFLTAIGGCIGPSIPGVLNSLTLYSNRSKYGPYGEDLEENFICRAPSAKIVGFHGKTSPNLKSIGVHIKLDNYRDPCVGTSDARGGDSNKKVYHHDQSIVPETVQHWRRETISAQMADTFEGLRLVAADQLASSVAAQALATEKDNFRKCVEALQEIEQLNDKEFKAAINFLKDDRMAIAFLTLKGRRRETWLLSSIR